MLWVTGFTILGVLYHLRHPLLALDLVHEHVARDLLVFQSMQRGSEEVSPIGADYPFGETGIFGHANFPAMRKRSFEALDSKSSPTPKVKCMSAAGAMVLLLNYPTSIFSDLCLSKP
jgi:hypothetical protein